MFLYINIDKYIYIFFFHDLISFLGGEHPSFSLGGADQEDVSGTMLTNVCTEHLLIGRQVLKSDSTFGHVLDLTCLQGYKKYDYFPHDLQYGFSQQLYFNL